LGGAKYFDLKRAALFRLGHLSKHKTRRYARNLGGMAPMTTPMLSEQCYGKNRPITCPEIKWCHHQCTLCNFAARWSKTTVLDYMLGVGKPLVSMRFNDFYVLRSLAKIYFVRCNGLSSSLYLAYF